MSRISLISVAAWAALASLAVLAGCSDSGDVGAAPASSSGGTGGTEAPTLKFDVPDPGATQTLSPEEIRKFDVIASPPGVYRVRFSIVSLDQMPPHDASLNRTDADTDEDGVASVTLRAPSIATGFKLQASLGSMTSTSLDIDVQTKAEAELQVVPEYEGERHITEWVANAYMGTSCSELPLTHTVDHGLPADSTVWSSTTVFGIPPRLVVPVVPLMAVSVRAGHFAFGCANVDQPLTNELNTVRVPVSNVRIDLAGVDLDATLGIADTTAEWNDHLRSAADAALGAFESTTENDLILLLDTMGELMTPPQAQADFLEVRSANHWEVKALPALASMDGLLLRNKLADWLSAGLRSLASEDAFSLRILAPEKDGDQALLRVDAVAGVEAERVGFASSVDATWTADPNDTVALGATLRWSPSQLVTGLAEAQASSETPTAENLQQAFESLLDCEVLASTLFGEDDQGALALPECNAACGENLCQRALLELSERAREASEETQMLQLSATGSALVDDEAHPVSFAGSWRGTFPEGESSAVGGLISGTQPEGDDP